MFVYKFGGASVRDSRGIRNIADILMRRPGRMVVVVSAIGKTTNNLEAVLQSKRSGSGDYKILLKKIEEDHITLATELFGSAEAANLLTDYFDEAHRILEKGDNPGYDFEYDQVVSFGEIWSTIIVETWLRSIGLNSEWVDIRKYLFTDDRYRDANVNWDQSTPKIRALVESSSSDIIVTQGFIAGGPGGTSTTLGREGSDYSAAIIANICDAESVTIWKDVPGVLNADPDWIDDASKLDSISYKEAVEMSFSGAKVIHPKTIKPLHNKAIPLYVRSFLNPEDAGTVVSVDESLSQDIPVYVRKTNQVLISFIPKDFSFVIGDNLGKLFHIFYQNGIKTNLVQASAISIAVCIDNEEERLEMVKSILEPDYKILINSGVELMTLRYYNPMAIKKITGEREVLIEQRTRKSIRFVVK